MSNVKVVKSDPPESKEILAEAIVRIGDAAERLRRDGGLNKRAIIILLQDATKVPKRDIAAILDALPRLRGWYCK
jgi:hypothetical protein